MCFDNLITGSSKNIEYLLTNPNFKFIEADVCDDNSVNKFNKSSINYIFHLASPASQLIIKIFQRKRY